MTLTFALLLTVVKTVASSSHALKFKHNTSTVGSSTLGAVKNALRTQGVHRLAVRRMSALARNSSEMITRTVIAEVTTLHHRST